MWKRTEELKPSSPGADAAEPAATTPNFNSTATPACGTISTSIGAGSTRCGGIYIRGRRRAPDVTSAISAVSTIERGPENPRGHFRQLPPGHRGRNTRENSPDQRARDGRARAAA